MKLGYDGIYSKVKIHSYEPQITIFEPENVIIEKVETKEELWNIKPHLDRIKMDIIRIIKEENDEYVIEEFENRKNNFPEYTITVNYKEKSIYVKIYYTGHNEGWIYVIISPYYYRNHSLGSSVNIFEPDWEDFGHELVKNLLMGLSDLQKEVN